ncbi:MAG TPA: hypothetical protein VM658_06920 [bacterium]|nr:hypothetical protein [bacterium]
MLAIFTTIYMLYVLRIVAGLAGLLLSGNMPHRRLGPVGTILVVLGGLVLLTSLYQNKEWARRIVLVLSFLLTALGLRIMVGKMTADYFIAKIVIHYPVDLVFASVFWLIHLVIGITIIYLAMAYPAAGSPAGSPSPGGALPKAR